MTILITIYGDENKDKCFFNVISSIAMINQIATKSEKYFSGGEYYGNIELVRLIIF